MRQKSEESQLDLIANGMAIERNDFMILSYLKEFELFFWKGFDFIFLSIHM